MEIDAELEALLSDIAASIVKRAQDNLMKKRKRQAFPHSHECQRAERASLDIAVLCLDPQHQSARDKTFE